MSVTKATGTPLYPIIDWASPLGILIPVLMIVASQIIFFLVVVLNRAKLKFNGHANLLKVFNKSALKNQVDPKMVFLERDFYQVRKMHRIAASSSSSK